MPLGFPVARARRLSSANLSRASIERPEYVNGSAAAQRSANFWGVAVAIFVPILHMVSRSSRTRSDACSTDQAAASAAASRKTS